MHLGDERVGPAFASVARTVDYVIQDSRLIVGIIYIYIYLIIYICIYIYIDICSTQWMSIVPRFLKCFQVVRGVEPDLVDHLKRRVFFSLFKRPIGSMYDIYIHMFVFCLCIFMNI